MQCGWRPVPVSRWQWANQPQTQRLFCPAWSVKTKPVAPKIKRKAARTETETETIIPELFKVEYTDFTVSILTDGANKDCVYSRPQLVNNDTSNDAQEICYRDDFDWESNSGSEDEPPRQHG